MSNKNYVKGRAREYTYAKMLETEGYLSVQRSRGSHSQTDLLATKDGECLHVQIKATVGKITPRSFETEIESFKAEPVGEGCSKRFVCYTSANGQRGWHTLWQR